MSSRPRQHRTLMFAGRRRLVVSGVDAASRTWSGKPADAMGAQASFPKKRAWAGYADLV